MDDQIFPHTPSPYHSNDTPQKNNKLKILILFGGIIIGVVLISLGYFAGKNSETTISPEIEKSNLSDELSLSPLTSSPSPSPILTGNLSATPRPGRSTISPTPTPLAKSKILLALKDFDGYRNSNETGNSTTDIRVGRDSETVSRGFVSFDVSEIPSSTSIVEAKIRFYQAKVEGSPYNNLGALKIDHLTYGDGLDSNDYGSPAIYSSFENLSTGAKIEWKEVDVTQRVKDDVANARNMSQFRIHFQTEVKSTGSKDFVYFESAENHLQTGNTPQLIVKYY